MSSNQRNISQQRLNLRPCCRFGRSHSSSKFVAGLRDTRGFVFAEQLIAIVFLGLLVVAIGVGLNVAFNSYRLANESTRANELLTRAVEEVSDELAFSPIDKVEIENESGVESYDYYLMSSTLKVPANLGNDPDGKGIVLVPREAGAQANPALLVASSHGLTVEIFNVVFTEAKADNNNQNTWSFRIEVKQQGSSDVIASTTMTVAWIG